MSKSRIVSYAQNFEDVLLWRALSDVGAGFYVDVGAQDPEVDSVTKLFYDHGWSGINIEPVPLWHERLCKSRPRDVNLRCAASSRSGTLTLHEVAESGLSTSSEEYAKRHAGAGRSISRVEVPSRTLDGILAEHGRKPIHFLKIDVEGMEAEVLAGLSLRKFRPWIMLVEATEPNSSLDVSSEWEALITAAGYRLAYHDGLNRYYVADERASLAESLRLPPNVFDDFVPYAQVRSQEYARDLEKKLRAQFERLEDAEENAGKLRSDLAIVTRAAEDRERRIVELDGAVSLRDVQLHDAGLRLTELRSEMAAVAEAAEKRARRIEALEEVVSLRDVQIHHAGLQISELHSEMAAVAQAAENRARRIEALEEVVSLRDVQVHDMTLQVSQLRSDVIEVTAAAENRARRIEELEGVIHSLSARLEESGKLRWRMAGLTDELRRVRAQTDVLRSERDSLYETGVLAQSHIRALTMKLEDNYARLVGLHADLERLTSSRSWRVTRPMRDGARSARTLVRALLNTVSRKRWMRSVGRVLFPPGSRTRRHLLAIGEILPGVAPITLAAMTPTVEPVEMTREARRAYGLLSSQTEPEQESASRQ